MAACCFGAADLRMKNLDLGSVGTGLPVLRAAGSVRFDGLAFSRGLTKPLVVCRGSVSETKSIAKVEENSRDTGSSRTVNTHIPSAFEVESFLTVLCDTTSIAEFKLKLGGFELYVSRNLPDQNAPGQPLFPSPVVAQPVIETPDSNGSLASTSLTLFKPTPSSGEVQRMVDKAVDEGLVILNSPKVGFFRRSRTIKGKRTRPACKEKDIVKESQVLCYIDQLGGEIPIESDTSGEVVKILREDGEPVGYGDALIAVLPSFPGITQ